MELLTIHWKSTSADMFYKTSLPFPIEKYIGSISSAFNIVYLLQAISSDILLSGINILVWAGRVTFNNYKTKEKTLKLK